MSVHVNQTPRDIATEYVQRRWNPVPVPFKSKAPIGRGWQHRVITMENVLAFFNGQPQNIGVMMGEPSNGLTDADLDCQEAVNLAPWLLPKTSALFGRASKRASHWLYRTKLGETTHGAAIQFRDPMRRHAMLLELRIGAADANGEIKGCQTIFPGSVHETDEPITWDEAGEPAEVDGERLLRDARLLASCCLLARYWPGKGARHDVGLTLGGFFARAGFDVPKIRQLVEAIARAAYDEEWRDRITAARDAANAFRAGKNARGLPALKKIFGDEVGRQIADWLGYKGQPEEGIPHVDDAPPMGDAQEQVPPIELFWHSKSYERPMRSWLSKDLIPETGRGLASGQWGGAKTFGMIDLSASVMTKTPFAGREISRRGGVLFIAAEGQSEIPIRLKALVEHKLRPAIEAGTQIDVDIDGLPFAWVEDVPDLKDDQSFHRLMVAAKSAARAMTERFRLSLALIIIDTLSAAANFQDGNSAAEGQFVMNRLGQLSRATGAFTMAVDHFGKAVETGTRGTSAKEGSADVVLAFLADRDINGTISNTRMALRKLRGGKVGIETPFDLRVVDAGEGETTCIIDWRAERTSQAKSTSQKDKWPRSLKVLRSAITTALIDHGKAIYPYGNEGAPQKAATVGDVRDEFMKAYPVGADVEDKGTAKRMAFSRALKLARERDLIGSRDLGGVDHLWLSTVSPDSEQQENC
jgi:AAA domain/Bifunctional DNA primase/polymerase, N-terminal